MDKTNNHKIILCKKIETKCLKCDVHRPPYLFYYNFSKLKCHRKYGMQ